MAAPPGVLQRWVSQAGAEHSLEWPGFGSGIGMAPNAHLRTPGATTQLELAGGGPGSTAIGLITFQVCVRSPATETSPLFKGGEPVFVAIPTRPDQQRVPGPTQATKKPNDCQLSPDMRWVFLGMAGSGLGAFTESSARFGGVMQKSQQITSRMYDQHQIDAAVVQEWFGPSVETGDRLYFFFIKRATTESANLHAKLLAGHARAVAAGRHFPGGAERVASVGRCVQFLTRQTCFSAEEHNKEVVGICFKHNPQADDVDAAIAAANDSAISGRPSYRNWWMIRNLVRAYRGRIVLQFVGMVTRPPTSHSLIANSAWVVR